MKNFFNKMGIWILAAAVVLFFAVRAAAVSREPSQSRGEDYAEYETAVITDVLSDNTEQDPVSDNGYRGEQLLLADQPATDAVGLLAPGGGESPGAIGHSDVVLRVQGIVALLARLDDDVRFGFAMPDYV